MEDSQQTSADEPRFSCLYFGYGSNLSPRTMKQRCPDSLFVCLARLTGYRWMINSTGYANIVPSPSDDVYGSLCFLSSRDEAALDESEGVPWLYEKQILNVRRISQGGEWGDVGSEEDVEAVVYVDVQRRDEGRVDREYVGWIRKAIEDGLKCGMPQDYADKYLSPALPQLADGEKPPAEVVMVRTTKFGEEAMNVPRGFASWSRG